MGTRRLTVMVAFTASVAAASFGVACDAHADTVKSAPVRVAVVDTGVAPIEILRSHLVDGVDLADTAASTADVNGHGTGTAGLVQVGCPSCQIMPVKAMNDDGTGTAQIAAAAVVWATAHGANVITLALTSPVSSPRLTAAIEAAHTAGVVVIVAAGNSGSAEAAEQGYPAADTPDAVAVASVDKSGKLYGWSNRGAWVHLAALGILPTLTLNGGRGWAAGTSASAAWVAGQLAGLVASHVASTGQQALADLIATATPVSGLASPGGRVNPAAARRFRTSAAGRP